MRSKYSFPQSEYFVPVIVMVILSSTVYNESTCVVCQSSSTKILQHKWNFFPVTVGHFATKTLLLFSFEAKLILTVFLYGTILLFLLFIFAPLYRFLPLIAQTKCVISIYVLSPYFAIHLVFALRCNFFVRKSEKGRKIIQK